MDRPRIVGGVLVAARRTSQADKAGAGGGEHAADKAGAAGGERKANRDDTCLNCNHAGHWARDCPHPRRERERAGAANAQKQRKTLLCFSRTGS